MSSNQHLPLSLVSSCYFLLDHSQLLQTIPFFPKMYYCSNVCKQFAEASISPAPFPESFKCYAPLTFLKRSSLLILLYFLVTLLWDLSNLQHWCSLYNEVPQTLCCAPWVAARRGMIRETPFPYKQHPPSLLSAPVEHLSFSQLHYII